MQQSKRAEPRTLVGQAAEDVAVAADARLPVFDALKGLIRKIFPDHWSFLLGELALYSFVLLLLTGVFLTFFFKPGMTEVVYSGAYQPLYGTRVTEAYASTLAISFDVRGGLLIRQVHHWAAVVFTAAIGVHLLRIFFTGAFRRPREVNWLVGLTLFQLALLEGFAGYSLPDDLLSGTGLRTAQGFMLSVPLVGTYLSFFAFGGQLPGQDIVPRLYSVHILLLPGLLLALITLHLLLVFRLTHTQWAGPGRRNRNVVGRPLFPDFAVRTGGLMMMVFGVLALVSAFGQINPIWLYGPYRPDQASTDAQPDWYMGFIEGALRLMPGAETRLWGHSIAWNPLIPAVLFPGAFFAVLYAYPFLEQWVTGDRGEQHLCDRPRNRPTRTGFGVAGVVFYAVLLIAGGQDIVARTFDVAVESLDVVLRICVLVGPPVAFWVTKRLCLALQARDRRLLTDGDETGFVDESVEGGFRAGHRPVPAGRRYTLATRNMPRPLPPPGAGAPWYARLRSALSAWYYRDRVELTFPEHPEPEPAEPAEPAAPRGE
ncbi:ubiquinol-cytochrome c reductase cytochrome b subunit [Kitasatospora atroaurantiaca]|uniref:Cytochrome bc1 complex cytochrome b subunit n=1 Tax=Kitasatospora atroaurantiaca TaxID=285545 RepID=A0A561EK18_9ACTN|nr:cytochrome b N-terminal domain-containing protein [Kitasatospora atroaurantiaca]TWE15954.1 menaquinol-cytochrome c reductase cytochrome b subunit precursor [Kitasatospora atroaurantiaca]